MSEERHRVLELLAAHKITVLEAERLLSALEPTLGRPGRVRVLVWEPGASRPKTHIEVPLTVARWGLRFIPERVLKAHGIDQAELFSALKEPPKGKVVDVEDERSRVEVYIE
jgi:hypothetical protein